MKIRAAKLEDAKQIARVMVDTWRTTYPGIVADSFLQSLCYQEREVRWRELLGLTEAGERYTYVAEEEGLVIGYISGGAERNGQDPDYAGEIYAIYIDQRFQSRGIGRQLVTALAKSLVAAGLTSMLVWVLAENPARAFYERLGGRAIRESLFHIGNEALDEVAYGWRDLSLLVKN